MDFSLNDEHLQAQKMVRDFAAKEVIPVISEWDRKQEMNPAFLPRMGELGILGIAKASRPLCMAFFRAANVDL